MFYLIISIFVKCSSHIIIRSRSLFVFIA